MLSTLSSFKFISVLSTVHALLIWCSPSNGVVTLVSILSLWPIELTFNLILERWFVNVVFQLSEIHKCAEIGIVHVTVSKVWIYITNSKLNASFCRSAGNIAFFFGVFFIREALDSIGVNLVTKCIFSQKSYLDIVVCALFSCLDLVTMNMNIIILVE